MFMATSPATTPIATPAPRQVFTASGKFLLALSTILVSAIFKLIIDFQSIDYNAHNPTFFNFSIEFVMASIGLLLTGNKTRAGIGMFCLILVLGAVLGICVGLPNIKGIANLSSTLGWAADPLNGNLLLANVLGAISLLVCSSLKD